MVVGEGFEPSKSVTADLQSAPFGRSGTPPSFEMYHCGLQRAESYQMSRCCKVYI
ncbi:conserved hypothetical protein [Photorhabdus asymbiotica]|uniref:Uncharacterized protein n=1 Tax=Photorhabdus asymbiotica subsp. asymbiotica (strain ATCC 43949 / 3105-77) TaxID=553480 RepID=C7BIH4_PHOAA|nr:conserved hypothetical protein [Photorhabdus asymbiotica]